MIRSGVVLAIARAEMRLTRRLARYWVFLALSYLIALIVVLYYSVLHSFVSSYSATAASIGPRYLIGLLGLYYLAIFMLGIVFLAFDLRGRDRRERMDEVLDSRSYQNLELVLGRLLGVLLPAWLPVLVLALLIQGLGLLLAAVGSPVGETVEPWSLAGFVFAMALPGFAFTIALVQLVTVLVRHRLAAAVIAILLLAGMVWATFGLALPWVPLFDVTGAYLMQWPSDIVPAVANLVGWLQRLGVLAAAFGLAALAAACHPRLDSVPRARNLGVGGVVLVVAVGLMATATWSRLGVLDDLASWRAAHEARRDEPFPDLVAVTGSVDIAPGRRLGLELELEIAAPSDATLEAALFSLNPGLAVSAVAADGAALEFSQADGLLEVQLARPLVAGEQLRLELTAAGRPDIRYGYLDAARVPEQQVAYQGQLSVLGTERAIYDPRFVALMPGVSWLPRCGVDVGRGDFATRPPDYFSLDLEVRVPAGWRVAAPGRAEEALAASGGAAFRFAPPAPVDEVAVVASRFERSTVELAGVSLELLLSPGHTGNLEVLAPAKSELESWISERLKAAAAAGLPYPYGGFTVVEVPTVLRSFGGGWRLDTVLAPPGMVLVRESCFPTARFDVPFRDPEEWRDREGGLARGMRDRVLSHFRNDFSGGNLLSGAARSFFLHLTSAAGEGAIAVDYALEQLTSLTVVDTRDYFSAHLFDAELGETIGTILQRFFTSRRGSQEFADALIGAVTARPEVWEQSLAVPLNELDPSAAPRRTIDVLALKAGALAQTIHDLLGAEDTARLLATLRSSHAGGTFDAAELAAAADTIDGRVGPLVLERLRTTDLPGFVVRDAAAFRLPDGADGSARYQLRVVVQNDEATPGMVRILRSVGEGSSSETGASDPIRIAGHAAAEYGVVLSQPPRNAWVEPYLSLNRAPFSFDLGTVAEDSVVDSEPISGVREVPWQPPDPDVVVVDDLDDGFAIVADGDRRGVRLGARASEAETDHGLPRVDVGRPPSSWSRATTDTAWGRYRHTVAWVRAGSGTSRAEFHASLPTTGEWELELHLPDSGRLSRARRLGTWELTVDDGATPQVVSFDATAAGTGWSAVGTFDLAAGEVTVAISDETDGRVVVADAVRWRRIAAAAAGGSP